MYVTIYVVGRETVELLRDGKVNLEDCLPFGLLRTAHLHHIPSTISRLECLPLVISVFKPFVLVLCVTDVLSNFKKNTRGHVLSCGTICGT